MKLFDVHTHVQFHAFKDDAALVIQRALDNNVWLINVGTQKDTSRAARELAHQYPTGIWATVGLHPIHTEKSYHDSQELGGPSWAKAAEGEGGLMSREEEFDYEYYKTLASDSKVVAIGECGLDYYRLGKETKRRQSEVFIKQIGLARELKKPLMIHCRARRDLNHAQRGAANAFDDLISILKSYILNLKSPGLVHFFSGTKDDAKKLLDLGFSFSFGGVITFARDYDEVVKYIPLEKMLLETDAPYVAPVPYRGKRNEPSYVIEVAKKIAELKNVSLEKVAEAIYQNTERIFLK